MPPSAHGELEQLLGGAPRALELARRRRGRPGTWSAGSRRRRGPSCRPRARGGARSRRVSSIASREAVERDDDVLADLASALRRDGDRDAVAPAPQRRHLAPAATGACDAERVRAERLAPARACEALGLGLGPSASATTMKPAPSGTPPGNAPPGRGQRAGVEVLERGRRSARRRAPPRSPRSPPSAPA